jgi:type IV pilus assembly protein PilQ
VESNIEKIRTLLKDLDVASRQVMIEARIVEATDTFQRDLGAKLGFGRAGSNYSIGSSIPNALGNLNYINGIPGTPGQPNAFTLGTNINTVVVGENTNPIGNGANTIGLVFRKGLASIIGLEILAGQTEGKTKILSNPKVMASDRVNAKIESGTEIPYSVAGTATSAPNTQFKKAVLELNVTPQITNNDEIIMDLEVRNDEPTAGGGVNTRNVTTVVRVENGGTLVIGGVFKKNQALSQNKVPGLGNIPVLGRLFRSDTNKDNNTELLIFITPTIVDSN